MNPPTRKSRNRRARRRDPGAANQALLLSGLTEIALGALTGWPYAVAMSDPEQAQKLGIRSTARLRQWHLDLIALGGLSVLIATAVPGLPRRLAWLLALGCWTNASSFGVLAFRPNAAGNPAFRAATGASFATVSGGFTALAILALRRAWVQGR